MELEKRFEEMTAQEQLKYLTNLNEFASEKLPVLEQIGDAFEQSKIKDMQTGLQLISAFSFAREFVNTTLRQQDYARRVNRLRYYVDKIQAKVQSGDAVKGMHGATYAAIAVQAMGSRRRGRPTKEEAAIYAAAKKAQQEEEEKQSLFAGQEEIKAGNLQPLTYGGIIADPDAANISESMPTLRQLKPFLSKDTQDLVDKVREMRSSAEYNATYAKALAEQGADKAVIEPYATEAEELVKRVSDIYAFVDSEMAEVYIRLKEDERYQQRIPQISTVSVLDLRTMFKPFYTKVTAANADFEQSVLAKIAEEDPETAARKQAEKDRHDAAAKIIKYLQRKDKPNTPARIAGMEKKLKELAELIGEEEAKVYEPLLTAAKEDKTKDESRETKDESKTKEESKTKATKAKASKAQSAAKAKK